MTPVPVKITTPVYQTKKIKIGETTSEEFECEDGSRFPTLKQAVEHEEHLERQRVWKSIKRITPACNFLPEIEWSYVANEEQRQYLLDTLFHQKHVYVFLNGNNAKDDDLQVGDWLGYIYEDGGDYSHDTQRLYTLRFVREEMTRWLQDFEFAGT